MTPACDFITNNLADNCQLSTANGPQRFKYTILDYFLVATGVKADIHINYFHKTLFPKSLKKNLFDLPNLNLKTSLF